MQPRKSSKARALTKPEMIYRREEQTFGHQKDEQPRKSGN